MSNSSFNSDESTVFDISSSKRSTPEGRLIIAVLERSVLDYIGNEKNESIAAEEWFFKSNDSEYGDYPEFSLEWVCQELDLNVNHVRSVIARMPKRGDKRVAPWYISKNYHNEPEEMLKAA